MTESMLNTSRYGKVTVPDWCNNSIVMPSLDQIDSEEKSAKAIETIYHDTIEKHRIMELYTGIRAAGPCALLRSLTEKIINELRMNGMDCITSMVQAMSLVSQHPDAGLFKIDHAIKLACESVVINVFWRYVPHPGFKESPKILLDEWDNFERERSHWWRARKAAETDDHIKFKWEALLADILNLLNFHNALLHTKDLLEKPTLKHTLHVAALTSEGRIYENGQGRSIASECRHILVRKECDIPIKSRPDRKPTSSGGSRSSENTKKKRKAYEAIDTLEYGVYDTTQTHNALKMDNDDNSLIEETNQFIAISQSRTSSIGKRHILKEQSHSDTVNSSSTNESTGGISPIPLLRATSNEWPAHLGLSPRVLTEQIEAKEVFSIDNSRNSLPSSRLSQPDELKVTMKRAHSAEEWPKHLQDIEGKTRPISPPITIIGLNSIFSPAEKEDKQIHDNR